MSSSRNVTAVISDVFRCVICLEQVQDARICPDCSKMCCNACITRWSAEQSERCPHCRAFVSSDDFVKCRWAGEIVEQLNVLQLVSPSHPHSAAGAAVNNSNSVRNDNVCEEHSKPLDVFCADCECCICHDDALFGLDHTGHTFRESKAVYHEKVREVSEELGCVDSLVHRLQEGSTRLKSHEEAIRRAKEERVSEIRTTVEAVVGRLDSQLRTKLETLHEDVNLWNQGAASLRRTADEARSAIAHSSPSAMIAGEAANLVAHLRNERETHSRFDDDHLAGVTARVNSVFASEIVPAYACADFVIEDFPQKQLSADPIYSPILSMYGLEWRLKLYPDGNSAVRGHYMSVFLELSRMKAPAAFASCSFTYQYKVEMLHGAGLASCDPRRHIVREFTSDFEEGECWGYNRFFRLDLLAIEGYIVQSKLALRFQVRAPTFAEQCDHMKAYMQWLEANTSLPRHPPVVFPSVSGPTHSAAAAAIPTSSSSAVSALSLTFSRALRDANAAATSTPTDQTGRGRTDAATVHSWSDQSDTFLPAVSTVDDTSGTTAEAAPTSFWSAESAPDSHSYSSTAASHSHDPLAHTWSLQVPDADNVAATSHSLQTTSEEVARGDSLGDDLSLHPPHWMEIILESDNLSSSETPTTTSANLLPSFLDGSSSISSGFPSVVSESDPLDTTTEGADLELSWSPMRNMPVRHIGHPRPFHSYTRSTRLYFLDEPQLEPDASSGVDSHDEEEVSTSITAAQGDDGSWNN